MKRNIFVLVILFHFVKLCLAQSGIADSIVRPDGFYKIYDDENNTNKIYSKKENKFYSINSVPAVSIDRIKGVAMSKFRDEFSIDIVLDSIGTKQFAILTREFVGEKIGFVFSNELIYTPTVIAEISSGNLSMSDAKSREELQFLVENIKKKIK